MQWNCSWEPTDWRKIRQKNGDNIVAIVKDIHETDPTLPIYLVLHDLSCQSGWYRFLNNKGRLCMETAISMMRIKRYFI